MRLCRPRGDNAPSKPQPVWSEKVWGLFLTECRGQFLYRSSTVPQSLTMPAPTHPCSITLYLSDTSLPSSPLYRVPCWYAVYCYGCAWFYIICRHPHPPPPPMCGLSRQNACEEPPNGFDGNCTFSCNQQT